MTNHIDLTGRRFGRLVVVAFDAPCCRGKETHPRAFWVCKCDCGTRKVICGADLRHGGTLSCGCLKLEHAQTMGREHGGQRPIIDMVGQIFGRLTVQSLSSRRPTSRVYWLCQCECGKQKIVSGPNLKNGHTRSCGCLQKENSIKQALARKGLPSPNRTHGKTKTAPYRAWSSMLQRCENPKNPRWPHYGARGIKVCDRWHSFEKFDADLLLILGPRPAGMSLDRKDNDGDYEPSNVRWATQKEQVANQRKRKNIDNFSDAELLAELLRRGHANTKGEHQC